MKSNLFQFGLAIALVWLCDGSLYGWQESDARDRASAPGLVGQNPDRDNPDRDIADRKSRDQAISLGGEKNDLGKRPGPAVVNRALEKKQELLNFVERHDPQVKSLLAMLERNRPENFRSALVGLMRDVEKLQALENRDPQRYDLELRQWKVGKRIQVVSARIALKGETPELHDELRRLIETRNRVRVEMAELDVMRTIERLERANNQLTKAKSVSKEDLDRQLEIALAATHKNMKKDSKHPSQTLEKRPDSRDAQDR